MSSFPNAALPPSAQDRLFEIHAPMIERLVDCLLRRRPDVLAHTERDDLLQDARLGLLKATRTFDPKHGARFTSWATTCIRSALCDALRAGGLRIETETFDEGAPAHTRDLPEAPAPDDLAEARILIAEYLPRLSQTKQRAIRLHFYDGLNKAAIARRLDVSERHAGRLLDAALAELRELAVS